MVRRDTYLAKDGALIERLASAGVSMVSVDHTVDISEARKRLDEAGYANVGLQGNLDPAILCDGTPGAKEECLEECREEWCLKCAELAEVPDSDWRCTDCLACLFHTPAVVTI